MSRQTPTVWLLVSQAAGGSIFISGGQSGGSLLHRCVFGHQKGSEDGCLHPRALHLQPVSDRPVNQPITHTHTPIRGHTYSEQNILMLQPEKGCGLNTGKKNKVGRKGFNILWYDMHFYVSPSGPFSLFHVCEVLNSAPGVALCSDVHFEECVLETVKPELRLLISLAPATPFLPTVLVLGSSDVLGAGFSSFWKYWDEYKAAEQLLVWASIFISESRVQGRKTDLYESLPPA